MALRPPSNQKTRDEFYSGDPAFVQLDRNEVDHRKAQAERERKIKIARENGDWSGLALEGATPTKFVMRPLRSTVFRVLTDRLITQRIGFAQTAQIAFRAAIVSVDLPDLADIGRMSHPDYGEIASEDVVDALDAIDKAIVTELGTVAYTRARDISPK